MPTCSALGCKRRDCAKEREMGYTFHVFPHSEPDILKQWVHRIGRKFFIPSVKAVLCSQHFRKEDFYRTGQTTRLRYGALPSMFQNHERLEMVTPRQSYQEAPFDSHQSSSVPPLHPESSCDSHQLSSVLPLDQESPHSGRNIDNMTIKLGQNCANIKTISMDHLYSLNASPTKLKRNLYKCTETSQFLSKKIKRVEQKSLRLKRRVSSLCDIIKILKHKNLLSIKFVEILEALPTLGKDLFKRAVKQEKGEYSEEIKEFAATLQFYSTKAYNYVRKNLNFALPHPSTLRKRNRNVHANSGFTDCAFDLPPLDQQSLCDSHQSSSVLPFDQQSARDSHQSPSVLTLDQQSARVLHQSSSVLRLDQESARDSDKSSSVLPLDQESPRDSHQSSSVLPLYQQSPCDLHQSFSVLPLDQEYARDSHQSSSVLPLDQQSLCDSDQSFSVLPLNQESARDSHQLSSVLPLDQQSARDLHQSSSMLPLYQQSLCDSHQSSSVLPLDQESPHPGRNIDNITIKLGQNCANIKTISMDHVYSLNASPTKLKRNLYKCTETSQFLSKKIKIVEQKSRRLKRKVSSLCDIIKILKHKNLLSIKFVEILEALPTLGKELFKRAVKQEKGEYSEEIKEFAATLQFYSTKAYNYVRKNLNFALPHPSTLRKRNRNVHANSGFTDCAFDLPLLDQQSLCNLHQSSSMLPLDQQSLCDSHQSSSELHLDQQSPCNLYQSSSVLPLDQESPHSGRNIDNMTIKLRQNCANIKTISMDHVYSLNASPTKIKKKAI